MGSLHVYMSHLCSILKLNALKAPHGQCVYECELGVHVHAGCFSVLLCICVCLNAVIFLCDHRSYLSLYVSVCVAGASFMVRVACVAHMASVVCIGSAASAVYMGNVVYMLFGHFVSSQILLSLPEYGAAMFLLLIFLRGWFESGSV